jgi:hypothetical protein
MRRQVFALILTAAVVVGCERSTSAPASPPPPSSPFSIPEIRLECAYDLFLFGPAKLASNYELDAFDARAIAEHDAEFFGYDAD